MLFRSHKTRRVYEGVTKGTDSISHKLPNWRWKWKEWLYLQANSWSYELSESRKDIEKIGEFQAQKYYDFNSSAHQKFEVANHVKRWRT